MEDKIRITLSISEATDLINILTEIVNTSDSDDFSENNISVLSKLQKAKNRYLYK